MRVALVTDTYTPQVNGVTTVLRRIVRAVGDAGHLPAVIAPAYPGPPPSGGTPELRVPSLPFLPYPSIRLSLPLVSRIRRFLDRFAPDVVHAATEGPLGLLGRRWALQRGVPLVTSYHTHFPRYCRDYGVPRLEPLVWRWIARFHGAARLTHTPGREAREALRAHGVTRAVVWGNGVDVSFFHPRRVDRAWRRELAGEAGRDVVLHVGRLAPEKNLDVLIEAWRLTRRVFGARVAFVVAGEGPLERRLRRALPWATHLGFLERERLAALYAAASLCVFPSTSETCGLVALEAMASGVPVVVADAGGFRDTVPHGEAGFRVSPNDPHAYLDAIATLLTQPAARRALAAGARCAAELHDAARENEQLLAQYAAVARGPAPEERLAC